MSHQEGSWRQRWAGPVAFLDVHTTYFESFLGQQSFSVVHALDFFKNSISISLRKKRRNKHHNLGIISKKRREISMSEPEEGKLSSFTEKWSKGNMLWVRKVLPPKGPLNPSGGGSHPIKHSPNFCTFGNNLCLLKRWWPRRTSGGGPCLIRGGPRCSETEIKPYGARQPGLGSLLCQLIWRDGGQVTSPLWATISSRVNEGDNNDLIWLT